MEHEFASLLLAHRRDARLTQAALAARANLSVHAISALERGTRRHPQAATVSMLADALALSAGQREHWPTPVS